MRISKALLFVGLIFGASACGSDEFAYDSGSFFPENWESTYTQVENCKKSAVHSGPYVAVWADAAGAPLYDGTDSARAADEGTIIVKPQYSDEGCTNLTAVTVMRKGKPGTAADKGDWEYQNLKGDGSIVEEGQVGYCVSCHTGCSDKDYLCDR